MSAMGPCQQLGFLTSQWPMAAQEDRGRTFRISRQDTQKRKDHPMKEQEDKMAKM